MESNDHSYHSTFGKAYRYGSTHGGRKGDSNRRFGGANELSNNTIVSDENPNSVTYHCTSKHSSKHSSVVHTNHH